MAERGEIPWSVVDEWEAHTPKGKKLPQRVRRKNPDSIVTSTKKEDFGSATVTLRTFKSPRGQLTVMENSPWAGGAHSVYETFVQPKHRGKGEGKRLVKAMLKHYGKGPTIKAQVSSEASLFLFWDQGFRGKSLDRAVAEFEKNSSTMLTRKGTAARKNPAKAPTFDHGLFITGTPGNRTLVLFDAAALRKVKNNDDDRLYDGSLIMGYLDMQDSSLGIDAYEVNSAAAKKGWGPALYDLASEVAVKDDMEGIHPMVQANTKAVMSMWRKFPKSRQIPEPMSKTGFVLAPPPRRKVGLPQVKAASKNAIRSTAQKVGWMVNELETHLFETGDAMFQEMYKNQQVKERSPGSTDDKYKLFKVASYDDKRKKAYSEFGGKRTWYSLRKGAKLRGAPGKGLHTSHDKQFVLDYYTELTDDPDVLLVLEADRKDVEKIEGDEVIVRQATLVKAVHL